MGVSDTRHLARHRNAALLREPARGDVGYFRDECAALAGKVALLSRENAALRARVEPLERRVQELEVELNAILKR